MDVILKQVGRARRRLVWGRFGRALIWSLFAFWLLATLGIASAKLWPDAALVKQWLPEGGSPWNWIGLWLGSGTVLGLIVAMGWTYWRRPTVEQTAFEVDRRFGLKERITSAVTLSPVDRQVGYGEALVQDASRRAERITIAEQFPLKFASRGLLPLIPLALMGIVFVLPAWQAEAEAASTTNTPQAKEDAQTRESIKKLQIQIRKKREADQAKGLEEAKIETQKRMEAELQKLLDKEKIERKDALVAINDIKKRLDEKREQLGESAQLKKKLADLKDIQAGPADKASKAIEQGDMAKAQEELKKLADKVRDGKLSEEEKKQLVEQAKQIGEKLKEMQNKQEQAKQKLEEEVKKAQQQGRLDDAQRMQKQLDEMNKGEKAGEKMQQMADAMKKAAEAAQQGNNKEAAEQIEQMANQLGEMQQSQEELEELEQSMEELSEAKDGMNEQPGQQASKSSGGQRMGQGNNRGEGEGRGKGRGGKGIGSGERDEQGDETSTYDSQVRDKPKNGRAVISGTADGPNKAGVTRESVKEAIAASVSEKSDSTEEQQLPKAERDQVQQYFDNLRKGE
jgi:methyl-accepting chemotaxis protein